MSRNLPDYSRDGAHYLAFLAELAQWPTWRESKFQVLQKKFLKADGRVMSKTEIFAALKNFSADLKFTSTQLTRLSQWLQMKPSRTISGVAPVTVLTKPFPCPGKCIFCPSDVRMPKSYLSNEPGAQRAEKNYFDPYLQTYSRLQAFKDMGHSTDKIELIILGGTWSFYPEAYQRWFIYECFRALNEFDISDNRVRRRQDYETILAKLKEKSFLALSDDPIQNAENFDSKKITAADISYNQIISELYVAPEKKLGLDVWQTASWDEIKLIQQKNELAKSRCVGLVIETRPDYISEAEVLKIRRLGGTKTQIGVQSLQDMVLEKNHRGHDVAATRSAFKLLRQAGFKIHAHWMPNLYGSSVTADIQDYQKLFADPDFKPDELKIYPCSLLESAELMQFYQAGLWRPYSEIELLEVLSECFKLTPPFCRLTRVIRDIPSPDIVAGNKKTNFRQIVQDQLTIDQFQVQDIRAREIRGAHYDSETVKLSVVTYDTSVSQEQFLQITALVTEAAVRGTKPLTKPTPPKLLAFLRLSLPKNPSFVPELADAAIIREIHVYGQVSPLGERTAWKAQHGGFGTQLIAEAKRRASEASFKKLAVISAVGTREYYRSRGFSDGELYQHLNLE